MKLFAGFKLLKCMLGRNLLRNWFHYLERRYFRKKYFFEFCHLILKLKKFKIFCFSKELSILKKSSYVRGLYMTFNLFTTRFAIFSTMISLSLLGENLSADKVRLRFWIFYSIDSPGLKALLRFQYLLKVSADTEGSLIIPLSSPLSLGSRLFKK